MTARRLALQIVIFRIPGREYEQIPHSRPLCDLSESDLNKWTEQLCSLLDSQPHDLAEAQVRPMQQERCFLPENMVETYMCIDQLFEGGAHSRARA